MKTGSIALRCLLVFIVLTGVIYPLLVTGLAQIFFPDKAGGTLIRKNNDVVGSELIGQKFAGSGYFWSRPSSAGRDGYDAMSSSGSNLGPISSALKSIVLDRRQMFLAGGMSENVPADLLFSSGSGLDPHISPLAAKYQISRVAMERKLSPDQLYKLNELVDRFTQDRTFGFLGEKRVNVLLLNLELDKNFEVQ